MKQSLVTDWNEVPVLFDIPLACRIFGVQRGALYKWIKEDNMPFIKICGGSVRFSKSAILNWLNEKEC